MDIKEVKDRAMIFMRALEEKKKALAPSAFSWYPYGTLHNFSNLDALLTGQHRLLLDSVGDEPIVDIGCADGDLAFFLESLGCKVRVTDYGPTNYNGMQGVRLLKNSLSSSVEIHETDLDAQFTLPQETYNLAFLLGTLYHLKNPYYLLETLARSAKYCLVSTRVAKFNRRSYGVTSPERINFSQAAVAYLLDEGEANNDSTNYWIFSDAGLRRILKRTNWEICDYLNVGNTLESDPASVEGDERVFCLIKSRLLS